MKKAARVTCASEVREVGDVFRRASADRREGLVAEFRVAPASSQARAQRGPTAAAEPGA